VAQVEVPGQGLGVPNAIISARNTVGGITLGVEVWKEGTGYRAVHKDLQKNNE
jgi:hypothetical protein